MIPKRDVVELQDLVESLFQCCQERMQYQSERFGLPDAELRCLLLFRAERYLTAKNIAQRLNVAKSRVTKLVNGLIQRGLISSSHDPVDSRVKLLSMTNNGAKLVSEVSEFRQMIHETVLGTFTREERTSLLNSLSHLKRAMKSVTELME